MNIRKTTTSLLLGATMLAGMPALAHAEEVGDGSRQDSEARLQTVTVTAQKREESLQDVPISIAAYTSDVVESAGAVDITSLNGLSPNVVLQTEGLVPNTPMVSIRGMSQSDPDPNADPKISTVIDGVYIPFVAGTMLDLFDIERVEVLKGPQGTLFGKNNLAGTINVVTSRPTDEFGGQAVLTVGENGLLQGRAKINTGRFANDKLAAKLAVNIRDYDGYAKNAVTGNKLNGSESRAARGAILFNPTENVDTTLIVDWLKQDTTGPAGHTVDNGDARYLLLPEEARNDIYVSAIPFDPIANTETKGLAWETNWDTGAGVITSVIGYRELTYLTHGDFDGLTSPAPGLDVTRDFDSDSFSAEVRYASPESDVFDYVVGIYYGHDTFTQQNTVYASPPVLSSSLLDQDSTSSAIFAQANWYVTPKWTLTFGGRYTDDQKNYSIDANVYVNDVFIAASSFEDDLDASWNNFTPRIAVQYTPTDNMLVYGSVSTGYKGGGFNSRGTTAENVGPYDEETVTAYEIGFKSDLASNLRLNGAVFKNEFSDLQGSVTRQGAVRAENITSNIADAETSGIELEAQWLPTENLSFALNFAYLDAKYTDFCQDVDGAFTDGSAEPRQCGDATEILVSGTPTGLYAVPVDSTNLDLANAPPLSGSFIVDYKKPVKLGTFGAHVDFRYTDEYNAWGRSNDPAFYRDSVILVNGNIYLAGAEDRWKLMLYGRNLTDQEVLSGATKAGTNPIVQFYQAPREIGVELSFRF